MTRLLVVTTLVVVVLALAVWWRAARAGDARRFHPSARFPGWVTDGSARTWVVFTTEYCATCAPVVDHLEHTYPDDRVITIDAAAQSDLSHAFGVRRAPTIFRADGTGQVTERLVGAEAVRAHVADAFAV